MNVKYVLPLKFIHFSFLNYLYLYGHKYIILDFSFIWKLN